MKSEESNFEIINVQSVTGLQKYKEAFDLNGSPKSLERLNWMHLDNNFKETLVNIAVAKQSDVAAIYAAVPVNFLFNKKIIRACQSVDTLTDKNYRRKGLFVNLAEKVYAFAKGKGYEFIYGFPNERSSPGLFNKLGWTALSKVPFLIKPLRSGYSIGKLIPSLRFLARLTDISISREKKIKLESDEKIDDILIFDDSFTELWKNFSKDIKIAINRDAQYLNWRYLKKELASGEKQYFCKAIYKNEVLLGYIIFAIKQKHGGRIGYIMELIYGDINKGRILLDYAINQMIREQCDAVLAWSFPHYHPYQLYREKGLFNMPDKLRPIKLFFGVKTLNQYNDSLLGDYKNWFISYSDSDTV